MYFYISEAVHSSLLMFSWLSGFRRLIKVNKNQDQIPCLNGIRVLAMVWIVFGHQYARSVTNMHQIKNLEYPFNVSAERERPF